MKEYKTSEFAKKINVSKRTIIRWHNNGKLLPYRISKNGYRYYSQEQVDYYLNLIKNKKTSNENNSFLSNKKETFISVDVDTKVYEKELLNQLKKENKFLKEQLKNKDDIIKREQELRFVAEKKIIMLENINNNKVVEKEETKKWWKFW